MKNSFVPGILFALLTSAPLFSQVARYESRTVLSDSVNSPQDESALLLSSDGKRLYFVRSFHSGNVGGVSGKQDIYVSNNLGPGVWSKARNIGAPLNDEFHNAVCGVSADGQRLFLNAIKVRQDKTIPGISQSTYEDGAWTFPVALSTFDFPEKGFFQSFVSYDESVAIVSFEGKDSRGLEDLYVMKRETNGKFGDPIHLGEVLNTAGFETSPALSPDGKTLYFSSNGRGGAGDGDIFKSTRLDDTWTNWSKPESMGPRINTNGFDGSFFLDANGTAYFISGEGSSGQGDIYVISMNPPPPPKADPQEEIARQQAEAQRLAAQQAEAEKLAKEEAEKQAAAKKKGEPNYTRVDTLGQALFAFNSIVINPESRQSLQYVVKRLKKNSKYRVQLDGHTDDKGSEEYNQRLSERRAASVKRFLVKAGIPSGKIKTQGFGELNPIDDNSTEEGRSRNRRVEVKYYLK